MVVYIFDQFTFSFYPEKLKRNNSCLSAEFLLGSRSPCRKESLNDEFLSYILYAPFYLLEVKV